MTVRVGTDAGARIERARGRFALQVQRPSDLGAAIVALKLARVDILGLADGAPSDERPHVSPVVNAPGGPLVLLEHFAADRATARAIPEAVVRRLQRAGLEFASVEVPPLGGTLDGLDTTPHAVVLRLFPIPRGATTTIPADWLDIASEWVSSDESSRSVRLRIVGIESVVPADDVSAVIHECGLARAWCDAVTGSLDDRIRTVSLTFGRLPHLALAAGGPNVDVAGLVVRFDLLKDIARELAADVAYAAIDFEATFEALALGLSPSGWQSQGGASTNVVARELVDEFVPDAYPYQVLGPPHLHRLADTVLPAEPLGEGRVEIALGDPRRWMLHDPERDDLQAEGWELLRACLLTEDELGPTVEDRARRRPAITEPDPDLDDVDLSTLGSIPDLDSIVIERTTHVRRGTRLTLLELASWLNHESHSDAPASVAPVLATYARWLSAGLGDAERQRLKSKAAQLVGTAPAGADEEAARRWLATEELVKVHAPAWLRAAGLHEAADRLAALGPLTDDLELVRAVDVLGQAITVASRRIDITASIVNDDELEGSPTHQLPDEQLVWEAWERVSESTGWVGLSEAATAGAPAELTYATDLRVIECSRDPRARDELIASRKTVGDLAWTTALHAVADEAWDRAWRAADLAARELSGFTVRVEMGRIAKTTLTSGRNDDELPEAALEEADRAARDALTRSALAGGRTDSGDHPWDDARNAARSSEGGKEWSIVLDEARRAVGEDAWAQAMADARAAVSDLLDGISDTVARVVVCAVAREATSAAARGVALRAAGVARAHGGDGTAAEAATHEALEAVATDLRARALVLLDRMLDPLVTDQSDEGEGGESVDDARLAHASQAADANSWTEPRGL